MELDSAEPTARHICERLRINGHPIRYQEVLHWLKTEREKRAANPHSYKTGTKWEPNGNHHGNREIIENKGEDRQTGTITGTNREPIGNHSYKVYIERDKIENSVSYSETSSRDGKKPTKKRLRQANEGESICLWVAYARHIGERGPTAAVPKSLMELYQEMDHELNFPPRPGI